MELRHIRYFIAVAEEGNFTRAAARVGIGQPPLSQQIRDLELEVGAELFRRIPQGAVLTEAGQAFLGRVRTMPDMAREAADEARRAGRGETGVLRVGFTGAAALNPIVSGTIRKFGERWPSVALILREGNSGGLATDLLESRLDIAFLRPGATAALGLAMHSLPDEPMIAGLPLHHPLASAQAREIRLADLRDEPFVLTSRSVGPTVYDTVMDCARQVGFEPILGQVAPQLVSVMVLVAAGLGVSLVPESMRQLAIAGATYRRLSDVAPVARLALATTTANPSVAAGNFLRLCV
jgi:DNA-binding transcriptional LysR family regulator